MIITEYLNNNKFVKHYSDKNVYILQTETGRKFDSATDIVPCRYTYTETEEVIPVKPQRVVLPVTTKRVTRNQKSNSSTTT